MRGEWIKKCPRVILSLGHTFHSVGSRNIQEHHKMDEVGEVITEAAVEQGKEQAKGFLSKYVSKDFLEEWEIHAGEAKIAAVEKNPWLAYNPLQEAAWESLEPGYLDTKYPWTRKKMGMYGNRYGRRRRGRTTSRGRYSSGRGKRARIGERVGTSSALTTIVENDESVPQIDTRELYSVPLIVIQPGQGINERKRQMVNVRGWKMDFELINQLVGPLYFNLAIVFDKGGSTSGGVSNADFFRWDGNDRSRNFSNALSGLEFHRLPINTDRYVVLKHKRYTLIQQRDLEGGEPNVTNVRSGKNYRTMRWYIKLKRQIKFDTSLNTPETGQCYLVYWCDGWGTPANSSPTEAAANFGKRIVMYFRDPLN